MLLSFWVFQGGFGIDWWGRYRFIEIHRVLAEVSNIEPTNITNGTWIIKLESKSNANHGTDYLNLPIDCWIFEASIEGVYFHAICFAQHLPENNSYLLVRRNMWENGKNCKTLRTLRMTGEIQEFNPNTFVQCQLQPSWAQSLPLGRACSCCRK